MEVEAIGDLRPMSCVDGEMMRKRCRFVHRSMDGWLALAIYEEETRGIRAHDNGKTIIRSNTSAH